jgi:hypothetical protein
MRGAPQVGFSATMRKISSRSSLLTHFLPARTRCRESQVQYSLKPARCHRTAVSGWTRINACLHPDQNRRKMTQKSLSVTASEDGNVSVSRQQAAAGELNSPRGDRGEKKRIGSPEQAAASPGAACEKLYTERAQIGYWANRHDSTADRYFGERHHWKMVSRRVVAVSGFF